MRLTLWVMLMVVAATVGGYFSYTQSRERTREINEIAPLEEGIDPVRIIGLLTGAVDPDLSDLVDEVTPTVQVSIISTTPVPTLLATEATPELNTTDDGITETSEPPSGIAPTWNDPRRVTILLLGIDQRQGETGPFPTDTIMVLSLNPAAKTGVILSIPRDLWVNYPSGLEPGRINTANIVGENIAYPGGGPEFAKRTVSNLLGIPIHYYIMINFDAFITLIDAIGDIEVCPPEPIDDPTYPDGSYGIRHITFEAGCQDLGAERLLEYARTRATSGGDVDRAKRQQETIFAVKDKITSLGGATSLIGEATTLWESLQANVRTDLTLQQLIELAVVAQSIPTENIRSDAIDFEDVFIRQGPEGEEILVPIREDIAFLVADLFGN